MIMRKEIDKVALNNIKRILTEQSGMDFQEFRAGMLEKRVLNRILKLDFRTLSDYVLFLRHTIEEDNTNEIEKLISELTVNETFFFRDTTQFEILKNKILPEFYNKKSIRIFSLACSTGEEPYSIAITLYENIKDNDRKKIDISGFDIDREALKLCTTIKYPFDSPRLRNVPANILKKYFKRNSKNYEINNELKKSVNFMHLNIINQDLPGKADIIFCKNVMIYFSEEIKEKLVSKISNALVPGGCLFLGITERLKNIPQDLEKISFKDTVLYRKGRQGQPEKKKINWKKQRKGVKNNNRILKGLNKLEFPKRFVPVKSSAAKIIKSNSEIFCIKLSGHIDKDLTDEYKKFLNKMNSILDNPRRQVIVDMSDVNLITREPLEKIIKIVRYLRRNEGELCIIANERRINDFINRMSIDKIVGVFKNKEEADKYFEKQEVR